MVEVRRKNYIMNDEGINTEKGLIDFKSIISLKLFSGSDSVIKFERNNKKVSEEIEFEKEDEEALVEVLKKFGTIDVRKKTIFEAVKMWLSFLIGCLLIIGVLYWLSIDGGSVRVPVIIIPVLEFMMNFGLLNSTFVVSGITVVGSVFSIMTRKDVTVFSK